MKKLLYTSAFLLASYGFALRSNAQFTTMTAKGVITSIEDGRHILKNGMIVGDSMDLIIKYSHTDYVLNGGSSSRYYDYNSAPNGMAMKIKGYTFQTDSTDVDFSVQVTNNLQAEDNILFVSWNNALPSDLKMLRSPSMLWKIQDPTQSVLATTALISSVNLASWQQTIGFSFLGNNLSLDTTLKIRGTIARITSKTDVATSFDNTSSSDEFNLYPNPSHDFLVISIPANRIGTTYSLNDPMGKQVLNGTLTSSATSIDIQSLAPGMYALQLEAENKRTFKVIKK